MWSTTRLARTSLALATVAIGCSKDPPSTSGAPSAASASAVPSASTAPSAPASAPVPSATASGAAPGPAHDCPKGSTGPGSFDKPCEGKGAARLMEAAWTGKTDDKGPYFRVTNKSSLVILYGKIAVYFYDKAGKRLDVQDSAATPPKAVPYRTCAGNIFSGVMKPAEKAVLQFSCVKKDNVPEGTATIEAELMTVGFSDAAEKKSEFYWTNADLVPETRKKGGVK